MQVDASFGSRFGPWALVVGGSEGLGAEFARALAVRGLDLVLVARRAAPLDAMARALEQEFAIRVLPLALDLSARDQQAELLRRIDGLEIGLLVCNAALAPIGPFLEISVEVHERILDLNCLAASLLSHALAKRMAERGRGGIILMSSMAGLQGTAQIVHYAATKAYLRVLAEGLFEELRPRGVEVIACCAGQVRTPAFEKSAPLHPSWLTLPVMDPAPVVAETLEALGRRAVVIPGRSNRVASFLVERLLPRRVAVALSSAATRTMYPPTPSGSRPSRGRAGAAE